MNKTFSEKIVDLVSKICITSDGHTSSGCGVGCELDTPEMVHKAIMEVVRELVPDKTSPSWVGEMATEKDYGWNACRNQILQRLGE